MSVQLQQFHWKGVLRVRGWPVAAGCSGVCRAFARSANSLLVFADCALAASPTGPGYVSMGAHAVAMPDRVLSAPATAKSIICIPSCPLVFDRVCFHAHRGWERAGHFGLCRETTVSCEPKTPDQAGRSTHLTIADIVPEGLRGRVVGNGGHGGLCCCDVVRRNAGGGRGADKTVVGVSSSRQASEPARIKAIDVPYNP